MRGFLNAMLDILMKNVYFFIGLFWAWQVFSLTKDNPLAYCFLYMTLCMFMWLDDRIKDGYQNLRNDLRDDAKFYLNLRRDQDDK